MMIPKVEGPWDIHYVDRLLAQLEAKAGLERPILVHAILETGLGVVNLEEIATASPRMQGMSFGPADLAASRRMKTTRVGGGHPGYRVIERPRSGESRGAPADRPAGSVALLDRADGRRLHVGRDPAVLRPVRRHSRTSRAARPSSAPRSCSAASAPGRCTRCRSTIAKKVFSPDPDEVLFAKKVLEAIPDGRGVHMIDGKMQDDATWKQCKVMVELAEMLAHKDPELAEAYGFEPRRAYGAVRISAKADYAVRAAVELAAATDEKPVKAERIATAQGIPLNFLENILGELRHAGIVRSHRGAEGGFRLAKPAEQIDGRGHHPRGRGAARERPRRPARGGGVPRRRGGAAARVDRGAGEPPQGRRARDGRRHRRGPLPKSIDKLAEDPEAWVTR